MTSPVPANPREKRRAARLAAVQALYQMDIAGSGILETIAEFETLWIGQTVEDITFATADIGFFREILNGMMVNQVTIDRAIDQALIQGWPLKRIEPVLRAILRAGGYEILFRPDVPVKAAINEYVEVSHSFYDLEEVRMVNGVLDGIARNARPEELDNKPVAGTSQREAG